MPENIEEVNVAFAGAIMVAPLNVTAPVGVNGTLPSGTKVLGLTDEEGVTITPSDDSTEINAWPRGIRVRTLHSNGNVEISFNLYQSSDATGDLYFAGEKNANGAYVLNASKFGGAFQLYIRTIDEDRGTQKLWVAEYAEVTGREAINLNHTSVEAYGLTVSCRFVEATDGNIVRYDGVYSPGGS